MAPWWLEASTPLAAIRGGPGDETQAHISEREVGGASVTKENLRGSSGRRSFKTTSENVWNILLIVYF